MILGLVVVFGLLLAFGTGMTLLYLSGWVSVKSTPERVIISRRSTNRFDPPEAAPAVVSWPEVRSMELACLGEHYHRLDGSTKALGMEPVGEELPSEAESYRENDGSLVLVVTDEMLDHERQVANTRAGRPAGQNAYETPPAEATRERAHLPRSEWATYDGLDDFGNLTAKDIGDMSLPEFDQFRRQFLAMGERLHRGMFG